jgi:hypothetical protein
MASITRIDIPLPNAAADRATIAPRGNIKLEFTWTNFFAPTEFQRNRNRWSLEVYIFQASLQLNCDGFHALLTNPCFHQKEGREIDSTMWRIKGKPYYLLWSNGK